jgi:predicted flap endonuclease-1-like 5' DNA nuclease
MNVLSDIPKTSEPAKRAFELAGIITVEDFKKWTEKDLLKLHGVGQKAIRILKEHGVKFKV